MNADRRLLRECLETAANTLRVNYGEFARQRGVHDFLIEIEDFQGTAQELAAKMLSQLYERGTAGSMNLVVLVAAIAYLDRAVGPPTDDRNRRHVDLKAAAETVGTYAEYLNWTKAWYP